MDTRRRNVRLLAAQWGGVTGLARKLQLSGPSYLSQLTGGQRPFTEKAARRIEAALDLPAGWMDEDHRLPARPLAVDESLVRKSISLVGAVADEMGVTLGMKALADVVELVYEDAVRRGQPDESFARRIITLSRGEK